MYCYYICTLVKLEKLKEVAYISIKLWLQGMYFYMKPWMSSFHSHFAIYQLAVYPYINFWHILVRCLHLSVCAYAFGLVWVKAHVPGLKGLVSGSLSPVYCCKKSKLPVADGKDHWWCFGPHYNSLHCQCSWETHTWLQTCLPITWHSFHWVPKLNL